MGLFIKILLFGMLLTWRSVIGRKFRPSHPMTQEEKDAILVMHNNARSSVLPPASSMRVLKWNHELAKSATSYAKKCVFKHSKGRRHSKYKWVGENLHIRKGPRDVKRGISRWENEKYFYDFYTGECKAKKCGHYTQMVWADTSEIGCGIALCDKLLRPGKETWKNSYHLVCHYGKGGNIRGRRPYSVGKSCRDCPSSCRRHLCYE